MVEKVIDFLEIQAIRKTPVGRLPKPDLLFAEDVDLLAEAPNWGTPAYVYSRATLERHWRAFDDALQGQPHLV